MCATRRRRFDDAAATPRAAGAVKSRCRAAAPGAPPARSRLRATTLTSRACTALDAVREARRRLRNVQRLGFPIDGVVAIARIRGDRSATQVPRSARGFASSWNMLAIWCVLYLVRHDLRAHRSKFPLGTRDS